MTRSLLPIGIQDFRTIRSEGFRYVDKTPLVRRLVDEGRHYFLSRPRRFGKSLLLDTLKCLFEGHESLFRGLDIHPHWDWSSPHPVVRLGFGGRYSEPGDVERNVLAQLALLERDAGLPPASCGTGPECLLDLLDRLHRTTGRQAAVLVDEYDRPILDALHDPEPARANRDYLRGFYGIVKGSAGHVRFVFVTGVSMFSRASLFSGLNNLRDISLDPRYGTICGYTEGDLDRVFAAELAGLDRDGIRAWYNGYSWLSAERVYNPHDVLLLLGDREFRSHWFETGSPTFLFRRLAEKSVSPMELEGRLADVSLVSKFDVDDIDPRALLFQTGYLTITDEERRGHRTLSRLDYPNLEVRLGLNDGLLAWLGSRDADPFDRGRSCSRFSVRTTSRASATGSVFGFRGSPTSGTRGATWPVTRRGTRASSTCACARPARIPRWRSRRAAAARTWCCASAGGSSCWSSRLSTARPTPVPRSTLRWRRCGNGAMRRDTARTARRSTSSAWPAGARRATSRRFAPSPREWGSDEYADGFLARERFPRPGGLQRMDSVRVRRLQSHGVIRSFRTGERQCVWPESRQNRRVMICNTECIVFPLSGGKSWLDAGFR